MVCIAMELWEFGTDDRGIKTKCYMLWFKVRTTCGYRMNECKRPDVADTYLSIQLLYVRAYVINLDSHAFDTTWGSFELYMDALHLIYKLYKSMGISSTPSNAF